MINQTGRSGRSHSTLTTILLTVLFLILLGNAGSVQAQWTTPDSSGNTNYPNGNVGIGTTTPGYGLEVNKTNGSGGNGWTALFRESGKNGVIFGSRGSGNGIATISGILSNLSAMSDLSLNPFGGNVGIGTLNPTKRLHVVGDNSSTYPILKLENTQSGGHSWWLYSGAMGTPGAFGLYDETIGSYRMYFDANGNAGLGTVSPAAKLDVIGALRATSAYSSYIADGLYGTTALPSRINTPSGQSLLFGYEDYGSGDYSPRIGFQQTYHSTNSPNLTTTKASIGLIRDGSLTFKGGAGNTEFVRIGTSGNVGIGTTTPTTMLDVAGQIRSSTGGFKFPDGTIQTTAATSGGGTITSVTAGVGLTGGGTGGAVTLTNDDRGSSQSIFKNIANAAGATQFSAGSNSDAVRFEGTGGTSVSFDAAAKKVIINSSTSGSTVSAANVTAGQFGQGNYSFSGNVGIGTTNPTKALDVVGDINVTGNINAKYQDVAEWVPAVRALPAGTVVILNPHQSNQVMASTSAYDTRVAGVVSERPGLALGEAGRDKVLVATTGRVKVMVDATKAPIQIGDLLVTSDEEGVAMKSVPVELGGVKLHRPGTLIGKALEPLEKGTGEILVLLSLQ